MDCSKLPSERWKIGVRRKARQSGDAWVDLLQVVDEGILQPRSDSILHSFLHMGDGRQKVGILKKTFLVGTPQEIDFCSAKAVLR